MGARDGVGVEHLLVLQVVLYTLILQALLYYFVEVEFDHFYFNSGMISVDGSSKCLVLICIISVEF